MALRLNIRSLLPLTIGVLLFLIAIFDVCRTAPADRKAISIVTGAESGNTMMIDDRNDFSSTADRNYHTQSSGSDANRNNINTKSRTTTTTTTTMTKSDEKLSNGTKSDGDPKFFLGGGLGLGMGGMGFGGMGNRFMGGGGYGGGSSGGWYRDYNYGGGYGGGGGYGPWFGRR